MKFPKLGIDLLVLAIGAPVSVLVSAWCSSGMMASSSDRSQVSSFIVSVMFGLLVWAMFVMSAWMARDLSITRSARKPRSSEPMEKKPKDTK